jgi:hypothetical protein
MILELNDNDLKKIDSIIQETPFKYSYPLFQFFTQKIKDLHEAKKPPVQDPKPIEDVIE